MIYSTEIKTFPKEDQYSECHSYNDENGFEWKIAMIPTGFFVAYYGHAYFKDKLFCLEVENKIIKLKNTGCFYVQNKEFDAFYEFRNILKNGYTDDIWDSIAEFLTERLIHDKGLVKCEIV